MTRLLLLNLCLMGLWGHCPQFPSLPVCPAPAPPPPPPPPPPPNPNPNPNPTPPPPEPPQPPPEPAPLTRILLSVNEVFLEGAVGAAQISSPQFPLIFLGDGLYWRTDVVGDNGPATWLTIAPGQGYDDADLRVTANASTLRAGTYTARISILAPGAVNSPQFVRVTLRVREPVPATIRPSSPAMTFTATEGAAAAPAPQKLSIKMEGETRPAWTAAATTLNGGNWLAITPAAGTGDGEITASVKTGDLPAGAYAGRITLNSPSAANQTVTIPVSFTIARQRALIAPGGVVNAASLKNGALAPGQLITIAGDRLGPATGLAARVNESTNRYPTALAGTRVLFDDIPGAILYASRNQINAQVPFEIAGKPTVKVTVEPAGFEASLPVEISVNPAAPGLFAAGPERAAALNQDYSLNTPATPAAAGDVIQLFLTGQGAPMARGGPPKKMKVVVALRYVARRCSAAKTECALEMS
ncbi:MAG: hypothetical protein FJW30_10430, partial [Acidobacteria bacterium]|nr:hypothetical protein [Acidobacteriota bacterium]